MLNKINIYIITQIIKYFSLIFFIFLSIAWLLQLSRLFTISNFMQVDILNIIYLSLFLIPNILTVISPFILIFGILLCFVKLYKDRELISILSLGLELRPIKISLIFFTLILIIIYSLLSFYIAPKIYKEFKQKEFEIRNTIDFDSMVLSNFVSLGKNTVLDFEKINNSYKDIFINYYDENNNENLIFAKEGFIYSENNKYSFQLSNGFKLNLNDNNEIEKLEFLNYILKIENKNKSKLNINDKNTFTIFDDFNTQNYFNIFVKFVDIIILVYVVYFFYSNNIKVMNLRSINIIYYCSTSIIILILNQILKNSEIKLIPYFIIIFSSIILLSFISRLKLNYE